MGRRNAEAYAEVDHCYSYQPPLKGLEIGTLGTVDKLNNLLTAILWFPTQVACFASPHVYLPHEQSSCLVSVGAVRHMQT